MRMMPNASLSDKLIFPPSSLYRDSISLYFLPMGLRRRHRQRREVAVHDVSQEARGYRQGLLWMRVPRLRRKISKA